MAQPLGQPAANREAQDEAARRSCREDHERSGSREKAEPKQYRTSASRTYHRSINLIVGAAVPHGQVALFSAAAAQRPVIPGTGGALRISTMSLDAKGAAALALHRFGLGPRAGSIAAIASDPRGALLAELDKPGAGQIADTEHADGAAGRAPRLQLQPGTAGEAHRVAHQRGAAQGRHRGDDSDGAAEAGRRRHDGACRSPPPRRSPIRRSRTSIAKSRRASTPR